MHPSFLAINKKIICIIIGILIAFFVIIIRLVYLQIFCEQYFSSRSQQNFIRHTAIESLRGNILDVNGKFLATNKPVANLYWQGTGNSILSSTQLYVLEQLELITHTAFLTGDLYDSIVLGEKRRKKIVLMKDIDFAMLSKIVETFPNHENLFIKENFKRYYPYQECCSHIIGYLGDITHLKGKSGLEKLFDENLAGKKGAVQDIVNSLGQSISHVELEKALIGQDLHTTINIDLQLLCEKVFPNHRTGSLIVFNPSDGSIISLLSRPHFNPNIFLDPISHETWNSLQYKNPFINRAFNASYPSGSIFKLVTISAALENGLIQEDSVWNCKGYTEFGNRKYWCARRSGHGKISVEKTVAQSCNTLFFEIGKKIDIDILAEYAHKFGLGEKTNILLPEKIGIIPTREWKLHYRGEPWWPGETLSVTIGQGYLDVTPIQIARMIASIFTGSLVSPRLLIEEPIIKQPLTIKPETITFLKKSMKSVVKHGTGKTVRTIKDIKIYAKTSTAQTSDFSKRKLDEKYLEHGWFVAYFQYKDYAPLVIVILVEHVGASQVATVIAKNFLIEYKKYKDMLESNNERT